MISSTRLAIITFFAGLTLISFSSFAFKLEFNFTDGETFCKDHGNTSGKEIAKWVSVPIDYKNPAGPKTLIYTYTLKPLDLSKPSLIYFVGGPGGSSRSSEFSLPNTNVIFFEQRGIGCSRPNTKELFLDPNFYSSENSARDGLEILNAYGIQKATIYGHSYGTVPATIFASFFPQKTVSLLLEGVVFKSDESLWISHRVSQHMERYFYSLSPQQQQRILSFTEKNDVPKTWYSYMARMTMSLGNFEGGMNGFLETTLFAKPGTEIGTDAELAKMFTGMIPKADTTTPAEQDNVGDITMGMISCKEMNMANPMLSHLFVFKNGHLTPDRNNVERESMCVPLGLINKPFVYYSAERYPITVPVTYFIGEVDPATPLDQGLGHFKNAQSKQKQALILKGGGHTPNIERLLESAYCDPSKENCDHYKQQLIQRDLFEKAVRGLRLSAEDLNSFNSAGSSQWVEANPAQKAK